MTAIRRPSRSDLAFERWNAAQDSAAEFSCDDYVRGYVDALRHCVSWLPVDALNAMTATLETAIERAKREAAHG